MILNPMYFNIYTGSLFFLIWGSFMAASYVRLMDRYGSNNHNISIWGGRSSCPTCKKKLTWINLIPVVSWILLKGKCAGCKAKISPLYPLVELGAMLVFIFHFLFFDSFILAFFMTLIMTTLILMSAIDLSHLILPDDLQLILFTSWLCFIALSDQCFDQFIDGVIGSSVAFLFLMGLKKIFMQLRNQDGLGMGDVKLTCIAGMWLSIYFLPWMMLIASLGTLLIIGAFAVKSKTIKKEIPVPFGPGLAFGFYVTLLAKFSMY